MAYRDSSASSGGSSFNPSTTATQYDDFIGNAQNFWQRGEGGGGGPCLSKFS